MRLASHEHAFAAALAALEALGQEERASTPRQTVAEDPAGKRSQRTPRAHASGNLAASDSITHLSRLEASQSSPSNRGEWRWRRYRHGVCEGAGAIRFSCGAARLRARVTKEAVLIGETA